MATLNYLIILTTAIGFLLLLPSTINSVYSCNDIICGSVVSKCMLTQSCKCDLKNCSCCKECLNCLGSLYQDCCSCVDLCPKKTSNDTIKNILSKQSRVDEFEGGIPDLFNALTSVPEEEKWNTVTFPIDLNKIISGNNFEKDYKYYIKSNHLEDETLLTTHDINGGINNNNGILNCTVVYLTQCLSWNKCKQNCESMGASSYRWFHDGCCECVGSTCINYGINESKCTNCPEHDNNNDDINNMEIDELFDEDWHDYGDGIGPLDDISNTNL